MNEESKKIDLDKNYLSILNLILAKYLPNKKVWAYGSRVKNTATERSDLDCVVFEANIAEIYFAQEALDNSQIPFMVKLLSWEEIPEEFKKNIMQKYFVLQYS